MRFRSEQRIGGPIDAVARVYTQPRFYELLGELPRLGQPEVLDRREDGSLVRLAVRFRFTGHLAPAVTKVIDPAKLTWVEQSVHDLEHRTVTFHTKPDNYADKLRRFDGSWRFESAGDGVTRRVADGDLEVKLPLYLGGGRVAQVAERAIIAGITEHFAGEVAVVERLLNDI